MGELIRDRERLGRRLPELVRAAPIHDIHTHLFAPEFGALNLRGIDALLDYHYVLAELYREVWPGRDAAGVAAMSPEDRSALIWQRLFVDRHPVSEACRGVVTCLQEHGLDPNAPLAEHRRALGALSPEQHVDRVLERSGVRTVVMTNDPFDLAEAPIWQPGASYDSRFRSVLRLDPLFDLDEVTAGRLADQGYTVSPELDSESVKELRRFLDDWIARMDPLYLAASLPPVGGVSERFVDAVLMPAAVDADRPLALMIGVRRGVNPAHGLAGDGLGKADLSLMERLCREHASHRFLCTVLARENQQELAVLARKFPNLHVFGCWWFVNIPSLTDEITRMRIELLGHSVTPQHSDARVLDQLLYKWRETRLMLEPVLLDKYGALIDRGFAVDESKLETEIADWLGARAMRFLAGDNA